MIVVVCIALVVGYLARHKGLFVAVKPKGEKDEAKIMVPGISAIADKLPDMDLEVMAERHLEQKRRHRQKEAKIREFVQDVIGTPKATEQPKAQDQK